MDEDIPASVQELSLVVDAIIGSFKIHQKTIYYPTGNAKDQNTMQIVKHQVWCISYSVTLHVYSLVRPYQNFREQLIAILSHRGLVIHAFPLVDT